MVTEFSKIRRAERRAEGASQLRDMVSYAWRESGKAMLGYPKQVSVSDLESGKVDPRLVN